MRGLSWLVIVGLSGCTAAQIAQEASGVAAVTLDGVPLLVDEPAVAFRERVFAPGGVVARLAPGWAPLDTSRTARQPRGFTVVDPTPEPRVVLRNELVDVLVFLDRADLQVYALADVDGTGPRGLGAVWLDQGVAVEILADEGSERLVSASVYGLTVFGRVAAHAVDEVFDADARSRRVRARAAASTLRSVVGEQVLLDAPDGDVIAIIAEGDDAAAMVARVVDEAGVWSTVEVERSGIGVRGVILTENLSTSLVGHGGCFGGCGGVGFGKLGRASMWPSAVLPAGSYLYLEPGGPIVARTRRDRDVSPAAQASWTALTWRTDLGEVSLWAHPGDIR